jgi:hypothetical protein
MLSAYCSCIFSPKHLMHCTITVLAHMYLIYPLRHVYVEPECEERTEQAQAKDLTNLVWIKANLGASNHCP